MSGYHLTAHACRNCLGRILSRTNRDGSVESICSNCEATANGPATELCCCGVPMAPACDRCGKQYMPNRVGHRCRSDGCGGNIVIPKKRSALRCVINERVSEEFPGRVVVEAAG